MDALLLARIQFGVVTVYHFLFVPLTIGTATLVALMQTAWVRTGKSHYRTMTKFWGELLLINFAIGVVTGIVQEFQFGMNWSAYSRFVGDVFGAPLAMEGLFAFFLEATFLGLWIFGWDRLPKWVHLGCIWLVAAGTVVSASFILAANSWMQHPVGFVINTQRHRAELTSLSAVLFNSTNLFTVPHVLAASFLASAAAVIGVSAWHLGRGSHVEVMRASLKLGMWVAVVSGIAVTFTGDLQGKVMTAQQPMKMAAAEALYNTAGPASFSLFTIGSLNGRSEVFSIRIPGLLSYLAHGNFSQPVAGINNVQAAEVAQFGPGSYIPVIPVTYWSFRLMIGFGVIVVLVALLGLWLTRGGRSPTGAGARWLWPIAVWTLPLPLVGIAFGWIFTEMGRQPWVVYGQMLTATGVSPDPTWQVLVSLIGFTLLYLVLAIVAFGLQMRYAKAGPDDEIAGEDDDPAAHERPLSFAY